MPSGIEGDVEGRGLIKRQKNAVKMGYQSPCRVDTRRDDRHLDFVMRRKRSGGGFKEKNVPMFTFEVDVRAQRGLGKG